MSRLTGTVAWVSKPRVYVCGERGCGTRSERRLLVAALEHDAQVVRVSCQSVCDGPVAGTVVAGELQWFERVAKPKARAGLARLVRSADGDLSKALTKRRKAKRAGKLRG